MNIHPLIFKLKQHNFTPNKLYNWFIENGATENEAYTLVWEAVNVYDIHLFIDAGSFYCPYVPLMSTRTIKPGTFLPSVKLRTRYDTT